MTAPKFSHNFSLRLRLPRLHASNIETLESDRVDINVDCSGNPEGKNTVQVGVTLGPNMESEGKVNKVPVERECVQAFWDVQDDCLLKCTIDQVSNIRTDEQTISCGQADISKDLSCVGIDPLSTGPKGSFKSLSSEDSPLRNTTKVTLDSPIFLEQEPLNLQSLCPVRRDDQPIEKIPSLDQKPIRPCKFLSYGDRLCTECSKESNSHHRLTSSREVQADWQTRGNKYGPRQSQNFLASEPLKPESRKAIYPLRDDDVIHEAQTKVITASPTKPRVYSIPRRRESHVPSEERTSNSAPGIPRPYPDTPPQSPTTPKIGPGIDVGLKAREQRQRLASRSAQASSAIGPTTPPTSGSSTPYNAHTARYCPNQVMGLRRPDTPTPISIAEPQLSELSTWILTELETSMATVSRPALKLDSPVLQVIRRPARERQMPRTACKVPLSRYARLDGPPTGHPSSTYAAHQFSDDKSILALKRVFPQADNQHLCSILATHLALGFVFELQFLFNSSLISPSSSHIPQQVPIKARAMLGLHPTTSRPPLPSFWRPERSWKERVEVLKSSLEREMEMLVNDAIAPKSMVDRLVKAVGEMADVGRIG